jgi:hypothetical protein
MKDFNKDDTWAESEGFGGACIYCGGNIRPHEAAKGNRECPRCRYGDSLGPLSQGS